MELGKFPKDEILDRLNALKQYRQADESRIAELTKLKDNLVLLSNAKVELGELHKRVLDNLDRPTPEIRRLALDALDLKIYASTDGNADQLEIAGVIPLQLALPTTAQTSA
ncbi:MAG: hypothetical protein HYX90_11350 [Chloroflexi bacterium]|nr:hypothetical protein [Chloroflexota bacterium]